MSAIIVTPSVIQGPAYILHGGVVQYVESDIIVDEAVESWTPKSTFGDAGERLLSAARCRSLHGYRLALRDRRASIRISDAALL